jgi:hypothetical protein
MLGGESPLWGLLEATISWRQLREVTGIPGAFSVRTRGMEARGKMQHRTKVNPRKAGLMGKRASNRDAQYPIASGRYWGREWQEGIHSYPGRSLWVRETGRARGGNDECLRPGEKSDHPIIAMKPVKVGRAKGAMG